MTKHPKTDALVHAHCEDGPCDVDKYNNLQQHANKLEEQAGVGLLERIADEIAQHDKDHPDHGVGCACHDKHAGAIRRFMLDRGMTYKNWRNLDTVLCYVQRNPPVLKG